MITRMKNTLMFPTGSTTISHVSLPISPMSETDNQFETIGGPNCSKWTDMVDS